MEQSKSHKLWDCLHSHGHLLCDVLDLGPPEATPLVGRSLQSRRTQTIIQGEILMTSMERTVKMSSARASIRGFKQDIVF